MEKRCSFRLCRMKGCVIGVNSARRCGQIRSVMEMEIFLCSKEVLFGGLVWNEANGSGSAVGCVGILPVLH